MFVTPSQITDASNAVSRLQWLRRQRTQAATLDDLLPLLEALDIWTEAVATVAALVDTRLAEEVARLEATLVSVGVDLKGEWPRRHA